jgi:hypothetical protein
LPLQITEPVSTGKCGKFISKECEWAFCYQFFAAGALWKWISQIFQPKLLKPFFAILRAGSLYIWKQNTSCSMLIESLSIDSTFDPC